MWWVWYTWLRDRHFFDFEFEVGAFVDYHACFAGLWNFISFCFGHSEDIRLGIMWLAYEKFYK